MAHDLIIRNGTVHDGTGAAAVEADIAIDGDRVTAIGDLADATAESEIDATGLAVTPGFVDLHTHMDAQIGWDPFMTSSSWHGVTTVLMGNCGVTFAPVAPDNRSYLAEMMESVEDIPREAILDGIPWDWETFPEYLDSVERMGPALNVVGMVGHCAVRYHVMGERSLSETQEPTPDELGQMRDIAAESVAGGAVGYSTSRLLGHRVPDGRCVPGTFSSIDEYLAIADGMNDAGGGLFQAVLDFDTKAGHEFELLKAMADRAGDVLFSSGVGTSTSGNDMRVVEMWDRFLTETRMAAGRISGICMTRPSGMLMGLHQVPPIAGKAWGALMALPSHAERVAALKDPSTRADLLAEGEAKGLWYDANHVYPMGAEARPDYNIDAPRSVAAHAAAAGVSPAAWVIDRLIESDGQELFNVWFFNRHTEALAEFLQIDGIIPGLGDAGAHAGQICDADATTHYLSYWMRDRGAVSLEDAVHHLTQKPADVLGLVDRGTLDVGGFADINVFDPATVDFAYPEYVHDFPNGKGRLRVQSTGYAATLVNGQVVTAQGEHTGSRPGRVIRDFQRG
ncbi:MAG: amidohydrolase family protein [Acidimicrobiales bacterium]|jgi:N-acyl-D-aspartate/D-glutamate deacylase|nr:amidohydrolase family protein [Acidimicrobiales bacterium]